MGLSLAAKTAGGTDAAFEWLLHGSGTTLATGFAVSLGEGTDTNLWLDDAGIGTRNGAGFTSKLHLRHPHAHHHLRGWRWKPLPGAHRHARQRFGEFHRDPGHRGELLAEPGSGCLV